MLNKRSKSSKARKFSRRKPCVLCANGVLQIDYKDVDTLTACRALENGKINARRKTGLCRQHQNQATNAIKRARIVALIPFVGAGNGRAK